MSGASARGFSIAYGPLEKIIANLCDASVEAVRVRFRKLRLRDFPDHIQIGSGSRVSYDLPRALAMCAAFTVSNGIVSQNVGAELVAETWPEWCRALIAAAVEREILPRPLLMPKGEGTVVLLLPVGFDAGPQALHMATTASIKTPQLPPVVSILSVDVRPILHLLLAASSKAEIGEAIRALDATFGWTQADLPKQADIAAMPSERAFLDDGPYFSRAVALLDLSEGEPPAPDSVRLWKMKLLSDYLQRPAPIDAWKGHVGDAGNLPRLHHLLAVCAREAGVELRDEYPHTLVSLAGADARAAARDMVGRGRSGRGRAT